ncbi:Penicillin-binding protein 4* [Caulifigura coniformis]|uniref:Penicillin-binding protein 4 n=1 Tax=Caulifigura coniformis TaxID=2527983 RepID=A0A517SD99_9PLAN|nr:serine hydrolase domain-containing protein [Caulifigura coniformis]QDT54104.1 Penicillin-binding protein 4* [Caulifigura coniformis]
MTGDGSGLKVASVGECGIDFDRWQRVLDLCQELTGRDLLPALSLCVVRGNRCIAPLAFGRRRLADADAKVEPGDRFVVASLTKPVVAMGLITLVEQGRIGLNDRVRDLIPAYRDAAKRPTTVRHLLTHTSGLPDSLPNNVPLRKEHAPLAEFVNGACAIGLDFPPGRGVQYQSLGYALLGEIIESVSGISCGRFLKETFFDPLGMTSTSLGDVRPIVESPVAEIRVPGEMAGGNDWNWNSRYWQQLGAPWGGMLSTAGDLARFCAMMLGDGSLGGVRVLSPATASLSTTNRLDDFPDVPEADRRTRPWGYGWRLNWPAHPACLSDLLPASAFGHWGATGTLFWMNRENQTAAVILSSQPVEKDRSPIVKLSNAITAAIRG